MAIDEVKFGELIGTVNSLVNATATTNATIQRMEAAIMPALKEARAETASYREEARNRQEAHDRLDVPVHQDVEEIKEWIYGDGTIENRGAKKELNRLINGKNKALAFMAGLAFTGAMAGGKLGELITLAWKNL